MMKRRRRLNWAEVRQRLRLAQQLTTAAGTDAAERTRILEHRAQLLAVPAGTSELSRSSELIMVFRTGADRFALPLSALLEVIPQPKCAPVPGAPAEVAGLIQVRGDVRPVYHLRLLLGFQAHERPAFSTVLLLRTADAQFGIGADEVEDVRAVTENQRRPAPSGRGRAGWMTEDLAPVLEVDSLVRKGE